MNSNKNNHIKNTSAVLAIATVIIGFAASASVAEAGSPNRAPFKELRHNSAKAKTVSRRVTTVASSTGIERIATRQPSSIKPGTHGKRPG